MKQTFFNDNIIRFTESLRELKKNLFNKGVEVTVEAGETIERDEKNVITEASESIENIESDASSETSESIDTTAKKEEAVVKTPPFINFTVFNRMGLTVRNLSNLLDSSEDFEMHIIDSNSKDDSWDYIQSLNDPRIKSKTRFTLNLGPIYTVNFNLSRRKPGQYFITVDSDVYIKTKNWISRFMEVFDAFPEVGVLGVMRDTPYPRFMPPVIPKVKGDANYLELKNAQIGVDLDFVPGHLQCLRPELIEQIGYWSEENGYGDAELSPRVVHYTPFKAGFLTTVEIDMKQMISCEDCPGKEFCKLSRSVSTCFSLGKKSNMNESFARKFKWKYLQSFRELEQGKRTGFCASVHDPEAMKSHEYNQIWAAENFDHYIRNSN